MAVTIGGPGSVTHAAACDTCAARADAKWKRHIWQRTMDEARQGGYISQDTYLFCQFTKLDPAKEHSLKASDFARGFARMKKPQNVFFYGPTGTGKTTLARCILSSCVPALTVSEMTAADLTFALRMFSERRISRHYTDVMLIDDVNHVEPHALQALLLAVRAREKKSTIYTANCSPAELRRQFSAMSGNDPSVADAILSRFNPCEVFEIVGKDLRKGI